jgi:hypothetical protein
MVFAPALSFGGPLRMAQRKVSGGEKHVRDKPPSKRGSYN